MKHTFTIAIIAAITMLLLGLECLAQDNSNSQLLRMVELDTTLSIDAKNIFKHFGFSEKDFEGEWTVAADMFNSRKNGFHTIMDGHSGESSLASVAVCFQLYNTDDDKYLALLAHCDAIGGCEMEMARYDNGLLSNKNLPKLKNLPKGIEEISLTDRGFVVYFTQKGIDGRGESEYRWDGKTFVEVRK